MNTRKLAGASIAAISLTFAVTALADNNFNSAIGCRVQSGSPATTVQYNGDGSITNPSTTSKLEVLCPIDRGPFGPLGVLAAAAFVSSVAADTVVCTAVTQNAEGNTPHKSGASNTGTGGREALSFAPLPHAGSFDYDYIMCTLDPSTTLYGYRGVEE
jgi:hypothetical protein